MQRYECGVGRVEAEVGRRTPATHDGECVNVCYGVRSVCGDGLHAVLLDFDVPLDQVEGDCVFLQDFFELDDFFWWRRRMASTHIVRPRYLSMNMLR